MNPHVTPVAQPYRRAPVHLERKLEEKLDSLERRGIIERVNEPCQWVSALVPVLKANGEVRPCVNMRPANKAIVRENHPLPTCEQMWALLSGSKVFSKLDIKDAFHQIELSPGSRFITTFISKRGLMRYTRLMFGINNAPELFQKAMDKILAGCEGSIAYLDDILVFGKDLNDHDAKLSKVLSRLQDYNVQLNEEKLELRKKKVKFVGHYISELGVQPAIDKLEAVRKFRAPASPEELRSFLGLIAYLGHFIPNLATKAAPLRRLVIEGKTGFEWKEEHEDCFRNLKESISEDMKLTFFDPSKETVVIVDASPVGLGAILTQKGGKNGAEIVMFASKTLSAPETRYCQTEKEALAIVWGVERFSHFLLGSSFTVVTDHKPLTHIFQPLSKPCARIERWVLRLQPYEFAVVYKKGKENIADPFSRLSAVDKDPETFDEDSDHYVNALLENSTIEAVSLAEIKETGEEDAEFGKFVAALEQEKWSPDISKWRQYAGEFAVDRGLLLRGDKIFIPQQLRKRVLNAAHEGHPGRDKMLKRLREKVWWPTLSTDVEVIFQACQLCAMVARPTPPLPMKRRDLPDGPWRDVAIDFTSASSYGKELLVIIDYYSRFVEIKIQTGLTASETTKSLRKVFSVLGFPRSLTCDNGQPFASSEFKEFCVEFNIKIFHTPPYWPQANGLVEKQNSGIKKRLQISKAVGSKNWQSDLLFDYLIMYRSTPQDTTGKSPFELMFGRKMQDKIPALLKPQGGALDKEVRERDKQLKEKGKRESDKRRGAKQSDIDVGDCVLLKNLPGNKLTPNFGSERYTVKKMVGGDCIIVSQAEGIERRRNITALKKVPPSTSSTPTKLHAQSSTDPNERPLALSLPQVPDRITNSPPSKRQRKTPAYLKDFVARAIFDEKGEM